MKVSIPFLSWTRKAALEVEIPDDAEKQFRLRAAVEVAVSNYADLARANLTGANLARANLARANLARADLAGAYLTGANLTHAYLDHANLTGANLTGAYLTRAYLDHANLDHAYLDHAYLDHAYLAGAYLDHADLAGAYLTGANLTHAYLAGAQGVIDAGTANGHRVIGWLQDDWLAVKIGCENKRAAEWRADPRRDEHRECEAALDYVEARARLAGWNMEPTDGVKE